MESKSNTEDLVQEIDEIINQPTNQFWEIKLSLTQTEPTIFPYDRALNSSTILETLTLNHCHHVV